MRADSHSENQVRNRLMYTLLILYFVLAIGFSFYCSVAEAVLLSVSPSYIASLKEKGRRSANLLEALKGNIDRPLAAILSLNTIAHTVGAAGVGAEAGRIWNTQAVAWASAVMTLLILVLSEIIPKTLGAVHWRTLAPWVARSVRILILVLYPLVLLSELLTQVLAGGKKQDIVTREEFAAMAVLGVRHGELRQEESRILVNLLRLRSLRVQDIMTPRMVIIAFPQQTPVRKVFDDHARVPVSRIPIYDGTIDHVTGFVLKNDVLLAHARGESDRPLESFRRELKAVPGVASLLNLFDVLLNQRAHLALVVDEYGGTQGIVTLEDLVETLLGMEIVDEADTTVDMQRLARERWKRRAESLGLEPVADQP